MKSNWLFLKILKVFVALFFVLVSIVFMLVFIIKNFNFDISKEILEYLKVFTSWQIIIFILIMNFLDKFKTEVKTFLVNNNIKKAGPFEFQSKSKETPEEKIEESLEQKGITLTDEQLNELNNEFQKLTGEITQNNELIEQNKNLINYLAQRAELYEFSYLNLYLVQNTKNALMWSYNNRPFTKEYFNEFQRQFIPNSLEVEAIFNALLQNELIVFDQCKYATTDKAERFIRFIGYIT